MQKLEKFLDQHPEKGFFILLLFALPAFFINLGLLPLFADEPTRANVALEMILSKNYSVPTVGGQYYYNKPPLYNWILAGTYLLTGSFSEFTTRLPAAIPMFLFALTIFYSVSHFLRNKQIAVVSGMLFLVNGRMLIYDSMLGHIDIFYSWLTYLSFILIFFFYQRKQWFLMFFVSYLITAGTFLSKGLPSVVFQGLTLIALLVYTKNWRKLLSWQHIGSGIICLLLISAYFFNYYRFNGNLEGYLSTIWDQSSKRTAVEFGLLPTFMHVITFPFEHLGHLFPASLLILFCLHKGFLDGIKTNPFLKYLSIVFIVNIVVYWLSPQTRPRYLLMLYPLLFILWSHAYYSYRDGLPKADKAFNKIILALGGLICLAIPAASFLNLSAYVPYFYAKSLLLFIISGFVTWSMYKFKAHKLLGFVGLLLVVRLAFSLLILPYRAYHKQDRYFKEAAIEMGKISTGSPFFFYQYHPPELTIPFHDRLIFYIQRTRMEIVKFTEDKTKPGYYFTFDRDLTGSDVTLIKNYQNLKLYKVK